MVAATNPIGNRVSALAAACDQVAFGQDRWLVMTATPRQAYLLLIATLIASLPSCGVTPSDPIPEHKILTLQSKALSEPRRITVYTPIAYGENPEQRFPVLYMPDGGIQEDFPHVVATIKGLIASDAIPPMLVVGIENTQRRRDLTGPTAVAEDRLVAPVVGGSKSFRAFVKHELIPEVEQRYRCNEQRAIVGESLAGLFVVETLLLEPKLFDCYIAISPSLWWNDHWLVRNAKDLLQGRDGHPVRLFLSHGNEADIVGHAEELVRHIRASAPRSLSCVYEPHPEEQHHTIFRAVKEQAFRAVLSK